MTTKTAIGEEKTKRLIVSTLENNRDGLTITDIAGVLDIHYTTASKYLAVLEAEKIIVHRNIGMAKVFRIREDRDEAQK